MDGVALTYDGSGNPTSYYNGSSYAMTWAEGRKLTTLTTGGKTWTYTYDHNGQRVRKDNPDGTYVHYYVSNGELLGEDHYDASGNFLYALRFSYDDKGNIIGFKHGDDMEEEWLEYMLVTNAQGDVEQVYRRGDDTLVATYTYDSWGNVLTATGEMAEINPFRYRSYVYDTESNFYHLQTRYYDPRDR